MLLPRITLVRRLLMILLVIVAPAGVWGQPTLTEGRVLFAEHCGGRISGTSRFFFELSGGTNSTIGSDQIDYVNFRPNRATEWDSTPIKMQPGIKFGRTSPG